MGQIEEKEKQRFLFLDELHRLVNGKENSPINMYEVGKLIGLDRNTVINIVQYLEGESLVMFKEYGGTITGLVAITHKGIREVDQAHNNPNSPTTNFPSHIVYVAGDIIETGPITGSTAINLGKGITTGDVNINSLNKSLTTINNEYSKSLEDFSQKIQEEIDKQKISNEEAKPIFNTMNELAKEVEDVKPGKEAEIDYVKQTQIVTKTASLIQKVLIVLPEWSETIANFTPLAPFSKLIGKTVKEIVDRIK